MVVSRFGQKPLLNALILYCWTYFYAFRSTQCSLMSSPGVLPWPSAFSLTFEERAPLRLIGAPRTRSAWKRWVDMSSCPHQADCPVFSTPPSLPTDTYGDPLRTLFIALSLWRRSGLSSSNCFSEIPVCLPGWMNLEHKFCIQYECHAKG